MQNSPRRGIPRPNLDRSDVPDIPQHLKDLVDFIDLDTPYYSGTLASRPAFNAAGHEAGEWYYATDTLQLFFNTGAAWVGINAKSQTQSIITAVGAGTYNTLVGCRLLKIEAVGGGGGGGGAAGAAGAAGSGGGGGAGAYALKYVLGPAASYNYVVGDGGNGGAAGLNAGLAGIDTTFGLVLTADGGLGGGGSGAVGAAQVLSNGGAGGLVANSVGDLLLPGGFGQNGFSLSASQPIQGRGGTAPILGSEGRATTVQSAAGGAGVLYGGGGFGGVTNSATPQAGGKGAPAIIVVTEYY